LRASRLLPSTTMRTSNSFDGRRRVTSSTVLNSGVSDRSRLGLRPATYSAPACPYQAAGHAADGVPEKGQQSRPEYVGLSCQIASGFTLPR
jgi:hypothetical protein